MTAAARPRRGRAPTPADRPPNRWHGLDTPPPSGSLAWMNSKPRRRGFTLIELLVAIAIVVVLAALALTLGPTMMKKGRMAKSISNMRQIGNMMMSYATDNNNRLPAMRTVVPNPDGSSGTVDLHWHQAILLQLYPDNYEQILSDREWWIRTDPIVKNPLFTEETNVPYGSRFEPWYPGYALNHNIWERTPTPNPITPDMDPEWPTASKSIPIAWITDPARTPLMVSHFDWHTYQFLSGTALNYPKQNAQFLIDGKMNVLFVDGHSELLRFVDSDGNALPVCEWVERKLHLQPPK